MPRLSSKIVGSTGGGSDLTALTARVADLEGADTPSLFAGRRFTFTDDWLYVGPMYASVAGTIGTAVGYHNFKSEPTMSASLSGITGSGRLGLVALNCGATSDGFARVHTCAMGAFDTGGTANLSSISYEAVVAVEALATVGDDYTLEVGLVGNGWALPTSGPGGGPLRGFGAFFQYDRASAGAKWKAVCMNEDVSTSVVLDGSGGTVDAGTITALSLPSSGMFRLKSVMESPNGTAASASAKFYVNDVLCATIATNLPTHSLAGSIEIWKKAGTNTRYVAIDYTCLEYQFRLDRVP